MNNTTKEILKNKVIELVEADNYSDALAVLTDLNELNNTKEDNKKDNLTFYNILMKDN